MPKTIRVGVIGAGAIGLLHLESWKKHPQIELAGVAEINAQRRKEAVERYPEMKGYEDYKEMLKDKSSARSPSVCPLSSHASAVDAIKAANT